MAKFVYEEAERGYIELVANVGEEIPADMVAAWAAIRQSYALETIANNLVGIDNTLLKGLGDLAG